MVLTPDTLSSIENKAMFNFLKNVRRGFATNSSSSHSLIYFKSRVASDHVDPSGIYYNTKFGWEEFVLNTLGEKLMYALVNLMSVNGYGALDAEECFKEYGDLFPEFDIRAFQEAAGGYIDHQSLAYHPEGFVAEVRNENTIIVGGNDNSWEEPTEYYKNNPEVEMVVSTDNFRR